LNLTTLVELRDVLCEQRLGEILDRAAGRTEDEVKALAAALKPSRAVPDLIRCLPGTKAGSEKTAQPRAGPLALSDTGKAGSGPELRAGQLARPDTGPAGSGPELRAGQLSKKPPRVEPISEEQVVVRMTVSREFVADLEKARAALSH